jgi:hypothetical protein
MKLNDIVEKVTLVRQEGTGAGTRQKFTTIKLASDWLVSQTSTFPTKASGDYHSVNLTIFFTDGTRYKGRLECNREEDLDVKEHFLDFLRWIAAGGQLLEQLRKEG